MSERPPNPPEPPDELEFTHPVTAIPPRDDELDGAPPGGGTGPAYATEVVNVDDDDS